MMGSFGYLYRQLSRATVAVLFTTLGFFGLTLLCALLGFPHAVDSFRGATAALTYLFGGLLAVFLVTSLVWSLIQFLSRRNTRAV
jgi:uncharacterized membrane protein YdcZ (DUF606 family)